MKDIGILYRFQLILIHHTLAYSQSFPFRFIPRYLISSLGITQALPSVELRELKISQKLELFPRMLQLQSSLFILFPSVHSFIA